MSTNSSNLVSKLRFLKDLGLLNKSIEGFTNLRVKRFNHVIERELVFYELISRS